MRMEISIRPDRMATTYTVEQDLGWESENDRD